MSVFGIGGIISKFNKLQREVDGYIELQQQRVKLLKEQIESAEKDERTAVNISKALKGLSGE